MKTESGLEYIEVEAGTGTQAAGSAAIAPSGANPGPGTLVPGGANGAGRVPLLPQ